MTSECRHVAKCAENFHKFTEYTHFLSVTKKWLVLTEQSIHSIVSTHYDVLLCKLQTTDVFRHSTSVGRRRQMCGKLSQIHTVHSLFECYKKSYLWIDWTINSWYGFNSLVMSSYINNKL